MSTVPLLRKTCGKGVRPLFMVFALAAAAGCSSTGALPFEPTSTGGPNAQLLPPTTFLITSQRINAENNTVTFSWASAEAGFLLTIGTSSGASNVLSTAVTGTTFTWTSPRAAGSYFARVAARRGDATSAFSDEQTVTVVDIRNMIEAMYFHTGPMSDATETGSPAAAIWADGSRLNVRVSTDAGETARAAAQRFADEYATLVGGAITATSEMTADRMQGTSVQSLPALTIGLRVQAGICSSGALACANYGPTPGPNRSMITFALAGPLNIGATAHEMGHAYGMGHIQTPAAGRPEFRFMMNSSSGSEQMTDAEKLAVAIAWSAGLRGGMSRAEAVSRGVVNQ
jgi:hypothetical protein